ncbi:MAG: hypothetical protein MAG715_00323 [Methanonatronarchaeales archaeon]|nr:hypothetical protein [Methanonatronarchaeales archaeon]
MGRVGLFEVIGNRNRRRMLEMLSERPRYVSELAEELGIGQKAVIDHLRVLDEMDLIDDRRGKHNRKYINLTRTLHAEVLISPRESRTVVTEIPRHGEGTGRSGAAGDELRSFERLGEELRRLNREVLEAIESLAGSVPQENGERR